MSGIIGNIGEFMVNGKESFESYEERMNLFFSANGITDANRKKSVFLTVSGAELYQLVRSLTSPGKPSDRTYDEVIELVKKHLNPKPNVIVERYKFNSRSRKSGESVPDFVAELRHLSRNCEFNESGGEMIRDRLVVGVNDVHIQRKLLGEIGLTLERAIMVAVGMETATREAATMSASSDHRDVHSMDHGRPSGGKFCRCGDVKHKQQNCFFKEKECFTCKKKGHISKVCMSRKKGTRESVNKVEQSNAEPRMETSRVDSAAAREEFLDVDDKVYYIYKTEIKRETPIMVGIQLGGKKILMEVDTGASLSVAGRAELERAVGQKVELTATGIKLKTYGGQVIVPLGITQVQVTYNNQSRSLPMVVTSGPGPILMGRNWLR